MALVLGTLAQSPTLVGERSKRRLEVSMFLPLEHARLQASWKVAGVCYNPGAAEGASTNITSP